MQFRINERQILEGEVPANHQGEERQRKREIEVAVIKQRLADEATKEREERQGSLICVCVLVYVSMYVCLWLVFVMFVCLIKYEHHLCVFVGHEYVYVCVC